MIDDRARRLRYFDCGLFADPAWDILLDLFVAAMEGREVPVTDLCVASNVADSTVLRWIGRLVAHGMVCRRGDPGDRRRVLVALTEAGFLAMAGYFDDRRGLPGVSVAPASARAPEALIARSS